MSLHKRVLVNSELKILNFCQYYMATYIFQAFYILSQYTGLSIAFKVCLLLYYFKVYAMQIWRRTEHCKPYSFDFNQVLRAVDSVRHVGQMLPPPLNFGPEVIF